MKASSVCITQKMSIVLFLCSGIAIVLSKPVHAQHRLFNTQAFYQHITSDEDATLGLTPIRFMNNETLIEAAAMQRDNTMPNEIRVLNALWLLEAHYGFSYRHHFRERMKDTVESFLNGDQYRTAPEKKQTKASLKTNPILTMRNYRIRVSDDKVFLRFKHHF